MKQNNFFDSIEELSKRIGKFVILRYEEGSLYAKLLTKIEITRNNSKIEGHKIWGKFLVGISDISGKVCVYGCSPRKETYGIYQYARDPTEKEIKLIRKKLRETKFRKFLIKSKL